MTEQTTPVELSPQVEIRDESEGTPRSVDVLKPQQAGGGRPYTTTVLALAAATQIFGSSYTGMTDDLLFSKDLTPLIDEEPVSIRGQSVAFRYASTIQSHQESQAEAANRTRLELLARLYVSKKLSPEEDARLAILTEKVRRLIPRVTAADFEQLEAIARESEAIRRENVERRRRLEI